MTSLRGLLVVALLVNAHAAVAADAATTPGTATGPVPTGDGAAVPGTGLPPLDNAPVPTDGAAAPGASAPAAAAPGASAPGASGALPPLDGPAGAAGPSATTASAPAEGTKGWPVPLLVGGGLLLIAGAGWAWTRLRADAAPAGAASWVRLPEAGVFGPGTPSLSDGWIRCAVDASDRDAALAGMLGTLADRRLVLVIARADVPVPPVRGHAVHRAHVARPTHVAQVLEALEARGEASALLLVEDDPAVAHALAEALPADTAALVLQAGDASPAPGWPSVALRRTDDGWTALAGAASVPLADGPDGFRPRGA